ncbi:uncharacterized protein N7529_006225 [Penicillium soppii]|uniref:uncharacterized protein n=1 Tax=Penicillium soppii TaxID=69789 RepID=UPI002548D51A|nr:uncharacterized protein N7529_006225 [Penicillium soppii]KAJ5864309.1 hypothetical protein N7529_006225 [Penicillium soppii]
MTLSISIDPDHGSDQFYSSEDEDSSGVHVTAPSVGSHEYQDYDEWAHLPYPDELKPSDSASRPRTSHRSRPPHGSRSASGRRPTSRRMVSEQQSFAPRGRRHPSPDSPESDSADEYPHHGRPTDRRAWQQPMPPGYPPSQSTGPSYNPVYPPQPGHPPYHNAPVTSDLMRIGNAQPNPYGAPPYGYQPQFPHGSQHFPPIKLNHINAMRFANICTIQCSRRCLTRWHLTALPRHIWGISPS